jgi:hypothetical protein
LGLDHDAVDVCFDIVAMQVLQGDAYGLLECRASVLESEGHADIAVRSHWGAKQSFFLVLPCHANLVVPRVRIQKVKEVAPHRGVDDLVDAGVAEKDLLGRLC